MSTERRDGSNLMSEAYNDDNVLTALADTDWFDRDYVLDAYHTEPLPEFDLMKGLLDKPLAEFLNVGFEAEGGQGVFVNLISYIKQGLVSQDGNVRSFQNVPFADDSFFEFAKNMGVGENYEVDRRMKDFLSGFVTCLVAPENLRRKVVRQTCSWGKNAEKTQQDILLWVELVKRGAKQFLAERFLQESSRE